MRLHTGSEPKKTDSLILGFNPYLIILALRLLVAEPGDPLDEYIDISSLLLELWSCSVLSLSLFGVALVPAVSVACDGSDQHHG